MARDTAGSMSSGPHLPARSLQPASARIFLRPGPSNPPPLGSSCSPALPARLRSDLLAARPFQPPPLGSSCGPALPTRLRSGLLAARPFQSLPLPVPPWPFQALPVLPAPPGPFRPSRSATAAPTRSAPRVGTRNHRPAQ